MKKISLRQLQFKKNTISNLEKVNGGLDSWRICLSDKPCPFGKEK